MPNEVTTAKEIWIAAVEGGIKKLAEECHLYAVRQGFWQGLDSLPMEWAASIKLALIHSEVSEALEALREGNPASEHIPDFSAMEEELADIIIRVLDLAGRYNLDVGRAITANREHLLTREHMHGKRF